MRTTLNIDNDLLVATREITRKEGATVGQVVSRLLHYSLIDIASVSRCAPSRGPAVAGFEPFPARPGAVTTDEAVSALRTPNADELVDKHLLFIRNMSVS